MIDWMMMMMIKWKWNADNYGRNMWQCD